jgi:perosamine synthetase
LIYDLDDFGWDVVCIDLDSDTWNMKVEEVQQGDAIFAVHNLGNIINVPHLQEKYGCPIIEDNCEGLFGTYNGHPSGSKSLCSSLSFFGNKNITCGEGGAYMTNEKDAYDFARKLWGQGQTEQRYIHDELGYNYRITNVQAAILLGQLEDLDYIKDNKERVFNRYRNNLEAANGISLQQLEENTTHSMWMNAVKFENNKSYEEANKYFNSWDIDVRPMFYPYTSHKHISFTGNWEEAKDINNKTVVFPSYPELLDDEVDYICEKIRAFIHVTSTNINT